jgi:hypothetical protein
MKTRREFFKTAAVRGVPGTGGLPLGLPLADEFWSAPAAKRTSQKFLVAGKICTPTTPSPMRGK